MALAALAAVPVLAASPAALAAPAASQPSHAVAPRLSGHMSVSRHSAGRNAAGDPCSTVAGTEQVTDAGIEVGWLKLSTYYCYTGPPIGPYGSGSKVTSHTTTWSVGVTKPGSVAGWKYASNVTGVEFHCFTSGYGFAGGVARCSGNYEYDEVEFDFCPIRVGCVASAYPYVWQAEWMSGAANQGGGVNS